MNRAPYVIFGSFRVAVAILGGTFFASTASAQEAPPAAPLPGQPANPGQGPAPAAPEAPVAPASEPPPAPPPDTGDTPTVAPAVPPPAVMLTASQEAPAPSAGKDHPAEEPDDGLLHHHQDHLLAFAGVRVAKISSQGFDPFADSDELAQFNLGVGGTILTSGHWSLAGLFLYDVGGRSGEARGANSQITVHRLTIGAEGRYHFFRQLFVFGRVAPGVIHSIASIEDTSVGVEKREARDWVFATDLSGGASLELSGWSGSAKKRKVNVWITLDGGYGFAAESNLTLVPSQPAGEQGGGPERGEPVDLGPIAIAGPFMRGAVVLTY